MALKKMEHLIQLSKQKYVRGKGEKNIEGQYPVLEVQGISNQVKVDVLLDRELKYYINFKVLLSCGG